METMRRSLIYVAGPLTTGGDVIHNVRRALLAGQELRRNGYAVIVPHENILTDLVSPAGYRDWLTYDRRLLLCSDAVLRLAGNSNGADEEEYYAVDNGIPVFYSTDHLYENVPVERPR